MVFINSILLLFIVLFLGYITIEGTKHYLENEDMKKGIPKR